MVDYEYKELFLNDSFRQDISIKTTDGEIEITNTELHWEEFELSESLCSESTLRFGACESSVLKFKISNVFSTLIGKELIVSSSVSGADTSFVYGIYKVISDVPTADKKSRIITAYDKLHDILNANVTAWYESLNFPMSIKALRDSFFSMIGVNQKDVSLVNDSIAVDKTISANTISGQMVINAICEINGCFGNIGRNGAFRYVFLPEMTEGLYPSENTAYISAEYEDFITERITKLQIRQEEDDIGVSYGSGNNCYVVQDNFLVYGKSSDELEEIAANLYSVISRVWYRPATVKAKGNPCLEVGDAIKVFTANADIYTYILQRTLKGIQALRDTYDAEGEQYQTKKVNSVQNQIIQLKGKANVLERTIEETKLTISDVERGLQAQVTQNAESISTEVSRATKAEGDLSTRITQTADSFSVEINNLQNQIDGNILTYNLNYVPTLTNYPAWDWTYNIPCNNTVQLRDDLQFEYKDEYWRRNARSVVFNTETFVTYRFLEKNGVWGWVEVADSEYSYVLQRVSELEMSDEAITASVKALEEEIIADYMTKKAAESLVSQTATEIRTEVSNTYETKSNASSSYNGLESQISQTAESIRSEVSSTYETKDNASSEYQSLSSSITQTASSIRSEVSNTYETKNSANSQYTNLSSRITQTAEEITSEVNRATAAEGNLSSRITQNANGISTKVSKGSVSSEISQEAGKISIRADRLSIASTNFSLSEDGTIRSVAGFIGGFNIADRFLYSSSQGGNVGLIGVDNPEWARIAMWAGGSNEDGSFFNAPFRVLYDGTVYCEKLIASGYTTTAELNAISARIDTIEAKYISAEEVSAKYATISSLNATTAKINTVYADYVKASTLGDDVVTAISGKSVYLGALNASGIVNANAGLTISGYDVGRKTATIGGVTIHYWGWD